MTEQSYFYCECSTVSGWAHLGDQWWVHATCGKPSRMFWEKKMGFEARIVWAPPPRGITKTTVRIGPDVRDHYTYLCEANDECMAIAYATTEESARRELHGHICPAPVRPDMMPSNRTAVQKMWDLLDARIDQIKAYGDIPGHAIGHDAKACALDIAMCLAFVSIPYFRSQEDILRQANRRWRIRNGEIPWEPTPGYNFYPAAPLAYVRAEPEVKPVKTARRAVQKVTPAKPVVQPVRDFTVAERTMIQEGVHRNGVRVADLAKMFNVSEERIRTIAGPSLPGDNEGDDLFDLEIF